MAFGAWRSPLDARSVAKGSIAMADLMGGLDGSIYWTEVRPDEGGRNVLMHLGCDKLEPTCLTEDVKFDVRTKVHEYGGAAHAPLPAGGALFSNFSGQQLWKVEPSGGDVVPVTLEGPPHRFADGVVHHASELFFCVMEDHTDSTPVGVKNTLCVVPLDSGAAMAAPRVIAEGRDFYSSPRLSPDGGRLAYVSWDHPNMPWDDCTLTVATLGSDGSVETNSVIVADAEHISALGPKFSPAGMLHWIDDRDGWWKLYKLPPGSSVPQPAWNDCPDMEFCGSGFRLGTHAKFDFLPDSTLVVACCTCEGSKIMLIDSTGKASELDYVGDPLPAVIESLVVQSQRLVVFLLGGSPGEPLGLYKLILQETQPNKAQCKRLHCPTPAAPQLLGYISSPRVVTFPTTGGQVAHGQFYPPLNAEFAGSSGAKPPLLVQLHGGPTACANTVYRMNIQFWTSRGFAVLDVDYRGSTGYGRSFRRQLYKGWGLHDVDDACAGAKFCASEGLVDPEKLAIDGGSAGGFTVLACLAFRDVFKAGCSRYGIADLEVLASETHKFESRYCDQLVGPYPEFKETYKSRSPIHSIDTITCPILLQHGEEDKVVPPNQSVMMYESVKAKGLPTALQMFKGEGHGFRKTENVVAALEAELYFFGKVFGYDPPDCPKIEVANLDGNANL